MFEDSTRLKYVPLSTMARPAGGGVTTIELPKTGILLGIIIPITVVIGGTVNTPNPLGNMAAIRNIQVRLNAGYTIFDMSGASYFELLCEVIQDNYNMNVYNDARLAVSTGTKVLDVFIPVSLNTRDQIGMLMLQNMQTFGQLSINWETDLTLGGSTATVTSGSATPLAVICEVPSDIKDYPNLDTLHQMLEDQKAIAVSGNDDHQIKIGGTIVGQYYFTGAVAWSNAELRLQQSNILATLSVAQHRVLFALLTSRDINLTGGAITGADKRIFLDFGGSDGLGQFGSIRDYINTIALTSIFTRITYTAATTLYALTRQILNIATNG